MGALRLDVETVGEGRNLILLHSRAAKILSTEGRRFGGAWTTLGGLARATERTRVNGRNQ
jgi:hypothetical protein